MARMSRTIISIPADEKKWLANYGKRHRISSAEVVRKAVREFRGINEPSDAGGKQVREERSAYGSPDLSGITDVRELRRRAIKAAGRFESGIPDLSVSHDRFIADEADAGGTDKDREGAR